jgi:hypothetical protein
MANTSISNLAAGAAVSATDLLPNVQTVGVGPVKTTAAQLKTFTSSSPTLVTPTAATYIAGTGDGTGTLAAGEVRGPAASGTNIAGTTLTISASNGTGTGGSGIISFRTASVGTSGSTANTLTERLRITANGSIGMGGAPSSGNIFAVYNSITGSAFSYAFNFVCQIQSDVTSEAVAFQSYLNTQAASFTLSALRHFKAVQSGIGSGSAVTNQTGFWADATMIGATNNYGFYASNGAAITAGKTVYGFLGNHNIATGGGTTWNFYANGTAPNLFSGSTIIGSAALATTATDGFLYIPTCAGAPTGVPTAYTGRVPMVYDSTNNKFYIYNGAWKSVTLA